MNRASTLLIALTVVTSLLAASAGGVGATTNTTDASAYAGTHVSFETSGDAVTDYAIDGETVFSSIAVQSRSEAESQADAGLGAGLSLEAIADLQGAGLSIAAESRTSTTVEAESGATLSAHDTERGHLVVEAGGEAQVLEADLGADAEARQEGDRVVLTAGEREGTFLVVGDGEVTVTDDGSVAADLEGDATLVFRAANDDAGDDEEEAYQTNLIADGNAAVEVHVDHRDGETVGEAITYGEETTAEVSQSAENRIDLTVDRTTSTGTVAVTTVSEAAVGSLEDLSVTVDGEAAAEASSKSELEAGAAGEEPRYMVVENEASASATVYVAFDHFSERTATIQGGDDGAAGNGGSGDDGSSGDGSSGSGANDDDSSGGLADDALPGFGVGVATLAVSIAAALARRHG